MKASRFNTFINLDGGTRLLFNSRSLALAELDPQTDQLVDKILSDPISTHASDNKQLFDQLVYGGFLVSSETDEIVSLKVEDGVHRFGNSLFSLAIAPTFECNLTCGYCSARNQKAKMTKAVEKALLVWAAQYVRKANDIRLLWFGGEPLLAIDTIERVQAGLGEMATSHGLPISAATVISNGYLLDGPTAERLAKAGVSGVQVTLDGPSDVHDKSRRNVDGTASFDRIVGNIAESSRILGVTVRINVDPKSPAQGVKVVEELERKGVLSGLGIYFAAKPSRADSICADAHGKCRPGWNLSDWQVKLYKELGSLQSVSGGFHQAALQRCGFGSESAYIVAPSGYLYKCWEEVSASVDASVGSVFVGEDMEQFQGDNRWKFTSFDPFENATCARCGVLPACMGGCPLDKDSQKDDTDLQCRHWRDNLSEIQKLQYLLSRGEEVRR